MALLAADTPPEVEAIQIELLRQMPPWRKLAMVGELTETVYQLALTGLRQRHPNDTPAQLRRRLADLVLGHDLAARAYGPPPEEPSC
jgi:hypothetical protein